MSIPIPILTLLLVIVASGLGTLTWATVGKALKAPDWVALWAGLFIFGAILLFGKIT